MVRKLRKGWGISVLCADDMYESANHLDKIVEQSISPGSTALKINYNVKNEAANLGHLSLMATDAVQTICIYPNDAESNFFEDEEFPGYYSSDDVVNNDGVSCLDDEFLYNEDD